MTGKPASISAALLAETTRLTTLLRAERRYFLRWLLGGVLAIVLIITSLAFLYAQSLTVPLPREYIIIFGSLVLSVPYAQFINYLYRRRGKKIFTDGIAASAHMTYRADGIFPVRAVEHHAILPAYDFAEIEDGFEGLYNGIPVAIQEVRLSGLEQSSGENRRAREYTAFWGMLVRIRLSRDMGGHTVVIPRTALQTFFRTRFNAFARVRVPAKFERKYHILGTDQVEARMIMNPAFMERFLEAANIMRARWMEVSFKDNEILFAVQRFRPLFEVGHIWQPVTPEYMRKLADHIDVVGRVIDTLRLNNHIRF